MQNGSWEGKVSGYGVFTEVTVVYDTQGLRRHMLQKGRENNITLFKAQLLQMNTRREH